MHSAAFPDRQNERRQHQAQRTGGDMNRQEVPHPDWIGRHRSSPACLGAMHPADCFRRKGQMREAAVKYANDEFCSSRFAKCARRMACDRQDVCRAGRCGRISDPDRRLRPRHAAAGKALPLLAGASRDRTGGQSRGPRVARSAAIAAHAVGAGRTIADGAAGAAADAPGMARNRVRIVPPAACRASAANLSAGSCGRGRHGRHQSSSPTPAARDARRRGKRHERNPQRSWRGSRRSCAVLRSMPSKPKIIISVCTPAPVPISCCCGSPMRCRSCGESKARRCTAPGGWRAMRSRPRVAKTASFCWCCVTGPKRPSVGRLRAR